MQSLISKRWYELADLCPVKCEIKHSIKGTPPRQNGSIKNGILRCTCSELGLEFTHPGFIAGSFTVGAFKTGELPRERGVEIK